MFSLLFLSSRYLHGWRNTKYYTREQVNIPCCLLKLNSLGFHDMYCYCLILPCAFVYSSQSTYIAPLSVLWLPVACVSAGIGVSLCRKLRWGMALSGQLMTRCYGFHVMSVKGRLATRKEAPIVVVAPHASFFDGLAVYWSKVPGIVSRIENLDVPLFGSTLIVFTIKREKGNVHTPYLLPRDALILTNPNKSSSW